MVGKIFVNPAGQRDNLGDSVLRRPYLDALRGAGRLHVLVGDDQDYASGLGLRASDAAYSSRLRWLIAGVFGIVLNRAAFAINAGEVVGGSEERRRSAWQDMLSRLAKIRRSPVVLAGVSIRPGHKAEDTRLLGIARRANFVRCRDAWSCDAVGVGLVAPDWAFLEGGDAKQDRARPLVAISMRGDRPEPSAEWFDEVGAVCHELGCKPVVVVQVRRDAERAEYLGARLGADVVTWLAEDNHAMHEEKIRRVYRQTRLVLSDRIHALILGVTEGAVPAGLTTDGSEKILRTFAPFTALPVAATELMSTSERLRVLADSQTILADDLVQARDTLKSVSHDLRRSIESGWSKK